MATLFVAASAALAWIVALAAGVAIIVNLPLPLGARLLLLGIGVWGYSVLRSLNNVEERLTRQEYWTRLAFITAHLRNEADSLPSAQERLQQDLSAERIEREITGPVNVQLAIAGGVIFLAALGTLLHLGLFGSVAAGWVLELAAWLQAPPKR